MIRPLRIGLLLFPHCMPAGLFAFSDLLFAANRRSQRPIFETYYVAQQAGEVSCAQGLSLRVSTRLDQARLDAILVPGFWAESAQQVEDIVAAHSSLVTALAATGGKTQLWSYCSGVSLLAASGKLSGQAATVTWWLAESMARRYPRVKWQSEQSCIINARTATASGVNGYLPIAQALIGRHVNTGIWQDLVRLMVLPRPAQVHDVFQSMSLIEQASGLLRQLHVLVEQSAAERITVRRLAEQLAMSERTLARKVGEETGTPIAGYVRKIKLNQASERLILTSASISTISAELGFSSDSNMRRMFKQLTALTPVEYRRKFARY